MGHTSGTHSHEKKCETFRIHQSFLVSNQSDLYFGLHHFYCSSGYQRNGNDQNRGRVVDFYES